MVDFFLYINQTEDSSSFFLFGSTMKRSWIVGLLLLVPGFAFAECTGSTSKGSCSSKKDCCKDGEECCKEGDPCCKKDEEIDEESDELFEKDEKIQEEVSPPLSELESEDDSLLD